MNKHSIITAFPSIACLPVAFLFTLVAVAGKAQVKCHIEGELCDTTQGKNVIVCPVSVDIRVSDKPHHTEAAIKELDIPYPQILNAQEIAAEAYHFKAIPYTLLFDLEGNLIARGLRGEEIDKKLAEIYE